MPTLMVSGSRHWTDEKTVRDTLNQMYLKGYTTLIHGGALGLDSIARHVWQGNVIVYRADWKKYGKGAGPIRNQEMVDSEPDLFLGFPSTSSVGTWDAIHRAREAMIPGAFLSPHTKKWISL